MFKINGIKTNDIKMNGTENLRWQNHVFMPMSKLQPIYTRCQESIPTALISIESWFDGRDNM